MWEGATIEEDPLWVAQAMTAGTLICVTDGSYDRRKAHDLSGAGWTLYCTATKKQLSGSLVERSEYASSYRGELLGMLAIHIFLHAVEKYFHAHGDSNSIYCDNKGAIYTPLQNNTKESRRASKTTTSSESYVVFSNRWHPRTATHMSKRTKTTRGTEALSRSRPSLTATATILRRQQS